MEMLCQGIIKLRLCYPLNSTLWMFTGTTPKLGRFEMSNWSDEIQNTRKTGTDEYRDE